MVGGGPRGRVPGTARRRRGARSGALGGFTTFRTDRILALEPDLVRGFSDRSAISSRSSSRGVTVLCTNQRRLDECCRHPLIGGALGCERARDVVADMRDEITQMHEYTSVWPDPPRVYFRSG